MSPAGRAGAGKPSAGKPGAGKPGRVRAVVYPDKTSGSANNAEGAAAKP